MSKPQTERGRLDAQSSSHTSTDFSRDVMDSIQALSQPLEMSDLSASRSPEAADATGTTSKKEDTVESIVKGQESPAPTQSQQPPIDDSSHSQANSAISPVTDKLARARSGSGSGPQLMIVLLLHSTGNRHPYAINDKYLKKRSVSVLDNDPSNMTVYTLKELIWRDWREGTESIS